MTAADPTISTTSHRQTTVMGRVAVWWKLTERSLNRGSEWLNPILVKEARQALKSKQFLVTFTLVLAFGWSWSMFGIAVFATGGPSPNFAGGLNMLVGYFWILAFPLIVIVPFSAYRSLAAEREDGTFELLSITALSSRQIIGGKFGSAVLQMLIYYSALSPCIAFTYLLRGVDIVTIILLLAYVLLLSVLLSITALFLATLTSAKHWQVVVSVGTILGMFYVFITGGDLITNYLRHHGTLFHMQRDYWISQVAIVSVGFSFCVLFFTAAAARINFASENRSTKLRIVMLAQQALMIGWIMWYWLSTKREMFLFEYFAIGGVYWTLMGALMTGESSRLTQRVTRRLPQSIVGRMFLTWFNPGPGTGYLFAITNLFGLWMLAWIVVGVARSHGFSGTPSIGRLMPFGFTMICYVAAYLGFGRLLVMVLSRFQRLGPFVSLVLQSVLIVMGSFGSLVLKYSLTELSEHEYTMLQLADPFSTLAEVAGISAFGLRRLPIESVVVVAIVALILLLANIIVSSGEVRHERQSAPDRVLQDEQLLHGATTIDQVSTHSFWDDENTSVADGRT